MPGAGVRYRFSAFTLSPARRSLVRDGREVPLIPRYFDLLLLLIERRREAVHRREIFQAALITAVCCGMAGLALTLGGRPLAGGTVHAIAHAADGSRATLAPLGRLIGEPDFGPLTRAVLASGEGAVFGLGLAWGLMRRPRSGQP
jgi:hypothetical protein